MKQLFHYILPLVLVLCLGFSSGAYAQQPVRDVAYDDAGQPYVDHEMVVRFAPNTVELNFVDNVATQSGNLSDALKPDALNTVNTMLGFYAGQLTVTKIFADLTSADSRNPETWIARGVSEPLDSLWSAFVVAVPPGELVQTICQRLAGNQMVVWYAHPNYLPHATGPANDAEYAPQQFSLHVNPANPQNNYINVEGAWDIATGRPDIKVGVFDSGIKANHRDFQSGPVGGQTSVVKDGYDWATGFPASPPTDTDPAGHGTSVAGIIGAVRNNGQDVAGIAGGNNAAPGVSLYSSRILDQVAPGNGATASNISAAIRAAAMPASPGSPGVPPTFGVQIMNHSWEISPSSAIIRDGMRAANRQGVTMVAASGNDNVYGFNLPGHVRDNWTVTVGGTGLDGEHFRPSPTYGSNNSSFVDVAAPADVNLVRSLSNNSAYTQSFQGTSAAAPHVTGIAALMMSYWNDANDKLAPEDVERVLEITATDKTGPRSGPLRDNFTGWGLVNATVAVAAIDKTQQNLVHNSLVPTPSDIIQQPSTTALYVYEVGGSFLNTRYEADVYKVTTIGPSYRDPKGQRPYGGAWVRNSSSSFYGPAVTYSGSISGCPTCPPCPGGCAQELEVEQNVTHAFAGKTGIVLTGYVYHLTFFYDPITGARTPTNTWLPANYNPALGGGRMDYSVLRGAVLQTSPRGINADGEDGAVSTSDGEHAVVAYPNPAQSQLMLQLPRSAAGATATVTVTTPAGQAVQVETLPTGPGEPTLKLSVRNLPEGLYFYRVVTVQGSYCGKFVKSGQQ